MSGIKHKKQSAVPDDPAADVGADEWNEAHEVAGDFDIVGAPTIPGAPAAGSVKTFAQITGVSPNRQIVIGYKLEDGTMITVVDVTI